MLCQYLCPDPYLLHVVSALLIGKKGVSMEEMMADQRTVDVIIPVYKPDETLMRLFHRLEEQSYPIRKIIVMNTEKSYWVDSKYAHVKN